MTQRPLFVQIEAIDQAASSDLSDKRQALLFSVTVCQRLLSVYKQVVESGYQHPNDFEHLQSWLNTIWDKLEKDSTDFLPAIKLDVDAVAPPEILNEQTSAATYVIDAFVCLQYLIFQSEKANVAIIAETALNILDAFIYDLLELSPNGQNDLTVDKHSLMQDEFNRQNRDLRIISESDFSRSLVLEIKQLAETEPLLAGHWYSNSQA